LGGGFARRRYAALRAALASSAYWQYACGSRLPDALPAATWLCR